MYCVWLTVVCGDCLLMVRLWIKTPIATKSPELYCCGSTQALRDGGRWQLQHCNSLLWLSHGAWPRETQANSVTLLSPCSTTPSINVHLVCCCCCFGTRPSSHWEDQQESVWILGVEDRGRYPVKRIIGEATCHPGTRDLGILCGLFICQAL